MAAYTALSKAQLQEEHARVLGQYEALKAKNFKLDMSRGRPGKAQLDLANGILTIVDENAEFMDGALDVRNYGGLCGIPSARAFFADILGCKPEEVFIGGSASLNLMYDLISKAFTHGLLHSESPWARQDGLKFLCPCPGYDRHFAITQSFGMELIPIAMTAAGPDMDAIEQAVKDPKVKGVWCVPKYSNPDGIIYSQETIRRFAALRPAAPDFVLMWDNAYCVHEFEGDYVPFPDILSLCREAGNPDMVFEFASTSKITHPGAGISAMACSVDNFNYMEKLISIQTISYDKVNQLRHVRLLKDKAHTIEFMKKHAAVMYPKFHAVLDALDREIAPLGIAQYNRPTGGYFISFNALPGTAKRTWTLCKEAGVTLTNAGATFPYGKDPQDSNIRIAPSLPSSEDLAVATEVLCVCLRLSALEVLLKKAQ